MQLAFTKLDFAVPTTSRSTMPSWEHIVNDLKIVTRQNIALCCVSSNASKGAKELWFWLASDYCQRKGIAPDTVAQVVRDALANPKPPC